MDVSNAYLLCVGAFIFVLLVATVSDLDWRIIPDETTFLLVFIGIITAPWNPLLGGNSGSSAILNSVKGMAAGFSLLWLVAQGGKIFFGREAMGGGDIKLMAGIGAVLGWQSVFSVFILSSLLGGVGVILGFLCRQLKRHQYIPFGPFICLAALLEFLFRCTGTSFCDIFKKTP